MNCLKKFKDQLKSFLKLENEFDVSMDNNNIYLHLKNEYSDLNNLRHIKREGDNLIIDLLDISDKNINLYVGNTQINDKNSMHKIKDIKILCNNVSIYLEDYNGVNYDNLCVKTSGKVSLSTINVKDNLTIIAEEIDSQIPLYVNSNNQNYTAKKMSIKSGFLDAENDIKLNAKELHFFHSGISSKNLTINSDNISLLHLKNFELDNLVINSNTIIGNDSTIVAKNASITANVCKNLNIISNVKTPKNKVKVKI